ncbi:hypothetical protein [Echinicola sp. 20G]|nr:hypothetical protein [Echinicola sp. 20G]
MKDYVYEPFNRSLRSEVKELNLFNETYLDARIGEVRIPRDCNQYLN